MKINVLNSAKRKKQFRKKIKKGRCFALSFNCIIFAKKNTQQVLSQSLTTKRAKNQKPKII